MTGASCLVHKRDHTPAYARPDEQELEAEGEPQQVVQVGDGVCVLGQGVGKARWGSRGLTGQEVKAGRGAAAGGAGQRMCVGSRRAGTAGAGTASHLHTAVMTPEPYACGKADVPYCKPSNLG